MLYSQLKYKITEKIFIFLSDDSYTSILQNETRGFSPQITEAEETIAS